ncbi:MAG: RNA-binding S4 domain-containing protein [Stellaceae bacterium]
MSENAPAPPSRRLDQWLWFARLAKSRSLAAKLCASGAITLDGVALGKSNHMVRVGDALAAPQGAYLRTLRVLALGSRRGPASEARLLYEEIAAPVHRSEVAPRWEPLLAEGDHEG